MAVIWPETSRLVDLYRYWPHSLPFSGGVLEQPAIYLDAMRVIEFAQAQLVAAQEKEQVAMEQLVRKDRGRK